MIPLVGHVNELIAHARPARRRGRGRRGGRRRWTIDFKFGTMIEIPRAVWVADKIAEHAEFFSFGTNDLTQMTFGYSRDDAEGGFLLKYVEDEDSPARQPLPDPRRRHRRRDADGRGQGPLGAPRPQGRHLRRARRRPRRRSTSARRSASTTCPARRSACRWRASRPPRRRMATRRATSSLPSGARPRRTRAEARRRRRARSRRAVRACRLHCASACSCMVRCRANYPRDAKLSAYMTTVPMSRPGSSDRRADARHPRALRLADAPRRRLARARLPGPGRHDVAGQVPLRRGAPCTRHRHVRPGRAAGRRARLPSAGSSTGSSSTATSSATRIPPTVASSSSR